MGSSVSPPRPSPPIPSTQESACGASRNERAVEGKEKKWCGCSVTLAGVHKELYLFHLWAPGHSSTPPTYQPALYSMGGALVNVKTLIWWLLTILPLAPRHPTSFDGVTSHYTERKPLKKDTTWCFPQHSQIWSSGHCPASLNYHFPMPSASMGQSASLGAFRLASGMSQTALTVSPGLPETHQALQEVLLKCLFFRLK